MEDDAPTKSYFILYRYRYFNLYRCVGVCVCCLSIHEGDLCTYPLVFFLINF